MASRASAQARALDRTSAIPLHQQLRTELQAVIEATGLAPGEALPGELRLCETYAVSRTVVRQALVDLEHEGVIERIKGRGTFVATARPAQSLVQSLTGQFEDLAAKGVRLRSRVRRLEVVAADPVTAAKLGVEPGSPVVLLERLRLVRDEPWVLVLTYLPPVLLPALQGADLEDGSLYTALERVGARPVRGTRTVEARQAGRATASLLRLARSTSPVLLLTSVGYGAGGRPVEYFEAHHRADRSRFEVSLTWREGVQTPPMLLAD